MSEKFYVTEIEDVKSSLPYETWRLLLVVWHELIDDISVYTTLKLNIILGLIAEVTVSGVGLIDQYLEFRGGAEDT